MQPTRQYSSRCILCDSGLKVLPYKILDYVCGCAGFETSTTTIGWLLYCIATQPEAQQRIAAELQHHGLLASHAHPHPRSLEWEDLGKLEYLRIVSKVLASCPPDLPPPQPLPQHTHPLGIPSGLTPSPDRESSFHGWICFVSLYADAQSMNPVVDELSYTSSSAPFIWSGGPSAPHAFDSDIPG